MKLNQAVSRMNGQSGATMWSTMTIALMIGFIAFLGFKMMFVYIDHSFVRGSLREIVNATGFDNMSRNDIRRAVSNRLTIDNIRDMPEGFYKISQNRAGKKSILVKYTKKVPIAGNISAVVEFDEEIARDER